MKTYEFSASFYATYGTFEVEAENEDDAYTKALDEIGNSIKDLPIEVEYDVDLVSDTDDDDECADEDEEEDE